MARGVVASMIAVKPWQSFHSIETGPDDLVRHIGPVRDAGFWLNGGYFLFRRDVFDYMRPAEELVEKPFQRLADAGQLFAYRHGGFWNAMDTFKDKIAFDRMNGKGDTPWKVWEKRAGGKGGEQVGDAGS
jgi:glucose-1-phosphate cytidylyltransferase